MKKKELFVPMSPQLQTTITCAVISIWLIGGTVCTTFAYPLNDDSSSTVNQDPVQPVPDNVLPPPLPPRPQIPWGDLVQSNGAPPFAPSFAPSKPPLAWRAKAQELKASTRAQSRTLVANYDNVIMSLVSSLPQCGLRVEVLNSRAGELLAAPLDPTSKQRVIFTFSEMPPGSVVVKAAPFPATKQATAKSSSTIDNLLQAIKLDDTRRGTL